MYHRWKGENSPAGGIPHTIPLFFAGPPSSRGILMARKILNRKELRDENDAAERLDIIEKKPSEKVAKKETKRKSRAKSAKEVRLKAFWGVYNQALNAVVLFEYGQRAEADKKAAELSESRKTPHFVQIIKKVIEE